MSKTNIPNNTESVAILEKYAQKSRQFTINDAASITGVPLLESEYAIKNLMEKYDVKLKVTENGDLIYDFGNMHRRNAKSFSEYFADFMSWLWTAFSYVYKFTISIVLVVYFIVFLVLLIGLAMASMAGNNENDNRSSNNGGGVLISMIVRTFLDIFMWNRFYAPSVYYTTDRYGYTYPHYNNRPSAMNTKNDGKKGFIASIYDFVFGPKRVEIDPLANKQEVASFLRKHKGIIVTSELQALAGWKRDEADIFMTECLAHFDGRAEVSPNGTLYGDYIELVRAANRTGEAPIIYYWDEYEAPYELTGNTTTYNVIIILMNIFNLVMSIVLLGAFYSEEAAAQVGFNLSSVAFLGWIPLVYSMLFFMIPLFRWIGIAKKNKQQHQHNIRKRLMKVIFQSQNPVISLQTLLNAANQRKKGEEELDEATVKAIMEDLVYDLKGELIIDPQTAELKYDFSELDRELADAEEARNDKNRDNNIGRIILNT